MFNFNSWSGMEARRVGSKLVTVGLGVASNTGPTGRPWHSLGWRKSMACLFLYEQEHRRCCGDMVAGNAAVVKQCCSEQDAQIAGFAHLSKHRNAKEILSGV